MKILCIAFFALFSAFSHAAIVIDVGRTDSRSVVTIPPGGLSDMGCAALNEYVYIPKTSPRGKSFTYFYASRSVSGVATRLITSTNAKVGGIATANCTVVGNSYSQAFVAPITGAAILLPTTGKSYVQGVALTALGVVVNASAYSDFAINIVQSDTQAMRYAGGVWENLGAPSKAEAANYNGTVVGFSLNGADPDHQGQGYIPFPLDGVPAPGVLTGINGNGLMSITTAPDAGVWDGATLTVFARLPGTANCTTSGINLYGTVVGQCDGRATQWVLGVPTDLNDLLPALAPRVLREATAVNASGQIAVNGSDGHAYIVTP